MRVMVIIFHIISNKKNDSTQFATEPTHNWHDCVGNLAWIEKETQKEMEGD